MVNDVANALAAHDLGESPGRVAPLSELDELEVADGYPEIRGWDIRDAAGRSIGYVYDLLVDVEAMTVRYLDVELDPEFSGSDVDRRVLIPLETVALDGSTDGVLLKGIDAADVHALVPYARRGVTRGREAAVSLPATLADLTVGPASGVDTERPRERQYDDDRLFARDRVTPPFADLGADAPPGPIVAAQPPRVDGLPFAPIDVTIAAVTVHKSVETERVREHVPVVREEVEIERRVLRPGEDVGVGDAHGDEIRIPIMAEEVVVEKRLVAKEVLIIRKRKVSEERAVEADVRREQVRVEDPLGQVRAAGESGGPEGRV